MVKTVVDYDHLSYNLMGDTSLFYPALGNSTCLVAALPYGAVTLLNNVSQPQTFELGLPQLFVYNCTNPTEYLQLYYFNVGRILIEQRSLTTLRDTFWGNVTSMAFVMLGVTTGSWLLLILMVLASSMLNSKGRNDYMYNEYANTFLRLSAHRDPRHAYRHSQYALRNKQRARRLIQATTIIFTAVMTAMLYKTGKLLCVSYLAGYQDTNEFQLCIVDSLMFQAAIEVVIGLLIDLSWLGILYNVVKFQARRLLLITGLAYCVLLTALRSAATAVRQSTRVYPQTFFGIPVFTRIDIATLVFTNLYYFATRAWLVGCTVRRRASAYRQETYPLVVVNMVFIITPFVFDILCVANIWFKTWTVYLSPFVKIIGLYTVDVWLTHIEFLDRRAEKKAVLGRRMSADDLPGNENPPRAWLSLKRGWGVNRFIEWFGAPEREAYYYEEEHSTRRVLGQEQTVHDSHTDEYSIHYEVVEVSEEYHYEHDYEMTPTVSLTSGETPQRAVLEVGPGVEVHAVRNFVIESDDESFEVRSSASIGDPEYAMDDELYQVVHSGNDNENESGSGTANPSVTDHSITVSGYR
ncbi:hypothetical protein BABINDRAFT_161238 [Babjeviella inositovora NRRL Y-12698]|uniref:PH-response regulator protein palH/RIM21 n=1 Tax=Babjeviella inositovora NRRL Y-12698 TaxID=984486 RepID=A0A1E3QTD4_9ASCO|nr:uncharacterized protein BABINDRAFT_161238 [Babjeviella inositovora NRRL Y-12698]ODQ80272.1 hypothetical protein BABINDRAFT_161238 [Babjeviella inositovora NRRL Y-12698]